MSARAMNEASQTSFPSKELETMETTSDQILAKNQLETVAQHNQEGIILLTSGGELQQALHLIAKAKVLLDEIDWDDKPGESSRLPKDQDWNLQGVPALEGGRIFVYNKPIRIVPEDDLTFCKAALLFNMSLVYHTICLQTGSRAMLTCALMFYDLSYQTFLSIEAPVHQLNSCRSDNNPTLFRFQFYALAAWNNQAQLHILGDNTSQAEQMLEGQKAMIADLYQRTQPTDVGLLHTLQSLAVNSHQIHVAPTAGCA